MLFSGGMDSLICWYKKFPCDNKSVKEIRLEKGIYPKSLDYYNQKLLAACSNGSIYLINY